MTLAALFAYCAQLFVSGLWQGFLLVTAVALCLRFAPKIGATARFLIWSLAFALALVTPFLHFAAHVQPAATAAPLRFGIASEYAIAGLWLALSFARLLQLGGQLYRLRLTWRRATPLPVNPRVAPLLLHGRRIVQLCASAQIDSPSVLGFRAHRLLIPDWMISQLTENDLRQIVLHEMEHLRRGDPWFNLLQRLGLALFPLNPALHWVDRKLALERELACDAGVVAATAEPLVYARCLTRLAESRLHRRRLALSLSAWTRQSELGRRILSLTRSDIAASPNSARFVTAGAIACLTIAGAAMARVPRLISFSAASAPAFAGSVAASAPASALNSALPAAVPVVYRPSQPAHAAVMDAVSPAASPRPLSTLLNPARRHSPAPHLRQTSASRPPAHSWPAQPRETSTRISPARPSVVPTGYVVPTDRSSYAAFGDGWLIVEL